MTQNNRISGARGAAYRRGTVLGLTVAEIFILLLFLLMLAFLVITNDWRQQQIEWEEHQQPMLNQLQEVLPLVASDPEAWAEAVSVFETPEEIVTLTRQKQEAERQRDEVERSLAEENTARREAEQARDEAISARQEAEQRRDAVVTAAQEELARVRALSAKRTAEVENELRVLREKGQNPPCWYSKVPDGRGGEREKPFYTLNVAVFDDGIVIRPEPLPEGGVEDDNGSTFQEEADALQLGSLPYDRPLTDTEVIRGLQHIHDAGKAARVRSYSCIFWVRVWDQTSPDAKERWKYAHDAILEGLFGTFSAPGTPWLDAL